MTNRTTETIRSYLLGTLGEERDDFEVGLMTDDKMLELLQAEEEELIQDYADGELSAEETAQFESHFLIADERRQKVEFAKGLRRRVGAEDGRPANESQEETAADESAETMEKDSRFGFFTGLFSSPIPAVALALVVVVTAVIGYSFLFDKNEPSILEREYAKLNQGDFTDLSKFERLQKIELVSGSTRGGSLRPIILRSGDEEVMIRLALPGDPQSNQSYKVELLKEDSLLFTQDSIVPVNTGKVSELRFLIPGRLLSEANHRFKVLDQNERIYNYQFDVTVESPTS